MFKLQSLYNTTTTLPFNHDHSPVHNKPIHFQVSFSNKPKSFSSFQLLQAQERERWLIRRTTRLILQPQQMVTQEVMESLWYLKTSSNARRGSSCSLTVFGLTVMKVKTPKARLGDINIQSLNSVPATPSFDTSFTTQIRIKNTNWGPYKFNAGTATFMYQGVPVGLVTIPKSKAGMRSTKKINVEVVLNSSGLPNSSALGNELSSGVLTLTSQVQLKGKVELMLIMKKNKNASMDCTIAFDLASKTVKSLHCK